MTESWYQIIIIIIIKQVIISKRKRLCVVDSWKGMITDYDNNGERGRGLERKFSEEHYPEGRYLQFFTKMMIFERVILHDSILIGNGHYVHLLSARQ